MKRPLRKEKELHRGISQGFRGGYRESGEQSDIKPAGWGEEDGDDSSFYTGYTRFQESMLARVRRATYGEDIGQFSWITADELRGFLQVLDLSADSHLLDVACGSGGPAIFISQNTGCRVTGIDVNEAGINIGRQTASKLGVDDRVQFRHIDASRPLPFADGSFNAIICIDAINHLYNRAEVLSEWFRVLCPGGRLLFTDAVIVTGMLLSEEIVARSSAMGQFIFTPPGVHDLVIRSVGFVDLEVEDVTATIMAVAKRWHDARAEHRNALVKIEGQAAFEEQQRMLATAHRLSSERRLSRLAYRAGKPAST